MRRSQWFQDNPLVLKFLVGERYKGWNSWPPLSVHSSVGKHLVLAYMPRDPKGWCLLHSIQDWIYPFKVVWTSTSSWSICLVIPKEDVLFHGTTSLKTIREMKCGYTWFYIMVYTRLSVTLTSQRSRVIIT